MDILSKLPPRSLEAERTLLGILLLEGPRLLDVAPIVRAEDFFLPDHEAVYRALQATQAKGQAVDLASVTIELERRGRFREIGGHDLLVELVESVGTTANAVPLALVVRDLAMTRELIAAANGIVGEAYSNQHPFADLAARAEQALFAVTQGRDSAELIPIRSALDQLAEAIDPARPRPVGVTTGLAPLDEQLGPIPGGHLVVLAARPSIGKSALALQAAAHIAETVGPALFVSLEMTATEVGGRYLSHHANINARSLTEPRHLADADRLAIEEARRRSKNIPLYIDESSRRTVASIASMSRRLKARSGLSIIAIDYLQLLQPDNGKLPRHEQVAQMTRDCKLMAKELGVPVVLLAQLNRQSEARRGTTAKRGEAPLDHSPRLHHLRESGSVEQDANVVLLLHRESFYDPKVWPGEADLFIAKNRGGLTGKIQLAFDGSRCRFSDPNPPFVPSGF